MMYCKRIVLSVMFIGITILFSQCTGMSVTPVKDDVTTTPVYRDPVTYTSEAGSVGMNVWFLSSWDGSNAFADLMKHGGNWNHVEDGEQPAVPMDEKGWPLSDFG